MSKAPVIEGMSVGIAGISTSLAFALCFLQDPHQLMDARYGLIVTCFHGFELFSSALKEWHQSLGIYLASVIDHSGAGLLFVFDAGKQYAFVRFELVLDHRDTTATLEIFEDSLPGMDAAFFNFACSDKAQDTLEGALQAIFIDLFSRIISTGFGAGYSRDLQRLALQMQIAHEGDRLTGALLATTSRQYDKPARQRLHQCYRQYRATPGHIPDSDKNPPVR